MTATAFAPTGARALIGAGAPTGANDNTVGCQVGDLWFYGTNIWICSNVSTGAAVWTEISGGGGGGGVTSVSGSAPIASSGGTTPTISISNFTPSGSGHAAGAVPDPGGTAGTTRYLREDATWDVPSGGGGGGSVSVACIQHQEPSGTFGGTSTGGAFETRPINTIVADPSSIIVGGSLSSGMFTLAPGTYLIDGGACVYNSSGSQLAIYNVTDSAFSILGGCLYDATTSVSVWSKINGVLIVSGSNKQFALQSYAITGNTGNGWGTNSNSGQVEVYASITITKVA